MFFICHASDTNFSCSLYENVKFNIFIKRNRCTMVVREGLLLKSTAFQDFTQKRIEIPSEKSLSPGLTVKNGSLMG